MFLKQSTTATVSVGPFVDVADAVTAISNLHTGGTLMTLYVSKNGAAAVARNAATIVYDRDGYYRVELSPTDTGTVGALRLSASPSGTLPVWRDFLVLPTTVYDALVAATDTLQVHAVEMTTGLITAGIIATGAIDADALAADAATELAAAVWGNATRTLSASADPTAATIADAVWDEARSGHTAVGSFGEGVVATTVSDKTGYALSAGGVSAVQSGLSTLTAQQAWEYAARTLTDKTGFALTAAYDAAKAAASQSSLNALNNLSAADAQTAASAALAAYDPPTHAEITAAVAPLATATALTTAAGNVSAIKAKTDSLPASPAAVGSAMTLAADAIGAMTLAADAGSELAAAVWSGATRTLTTSLDPTAATIAAAVWNALRTAHTAAGSFGEGVIASTVSDKTGYALSAAGVAAVQTGLSTLTPAGVKTQADQALADVGLTTTVTGHIDAAITTRLPTAGYTAPDNAGISAIKAKTDNLPANPAAVGSAMTLAADAITAATLAADAAAEIGVAVWTADNRALSTPPPTAAAIAAAVWDEPSGDHNSPDTTGNKLNSASAAGDPWTAALSGYGTGSAGKLLHDNLDAAVSTRSAHDAAAAAAAVWAANNRTLAGDATLAAVRNQTDKIVANAATAAQLQPAAEAAILAQLANITADILNGNIAGAVAPGNVADALDRAATDPWDRNNLTAYDTGSAGRLLATNLDAAVSSRAAHSAADAAAAVWSAATRTLAADPTLALIKAQTDKIVAGGASAADLQPAVAAALAAARLNELVAAAFNTPASNSLAAKLLESDGGTWRFKAATLATSPSPPAPVIDNAAIASAVWSAVDNGWAVDTMGQRITADMPTAQTLAAQVWSTPLAGYNAPGTAGYYTARAATFPTTAQIAGAVWTVDTGGYANLIGTMGYRLHNATPAAVSHAVWSTAQAAYTTDGTFGAYLDAHVSGRLPYSDGTGPIAFTYTLTSQIDNSPIVGVTVAVTSDIAGADIVAEATTNADGRCLFNLAAGTYYFWRDKPGWSFVDPDAQTVNI